MMQPEQLPSGGKLVIFFEFFQVQIYNIDEKERGQVLQSSIYAFCLFD